MPRRRADVVCNFMLSREERDGLHVVAYREGITLTELIRRALNRELAKVRSKEDDDIILLERRTERFHKPLAKSS